MKKAWKIGKVFLFGASIFGIGVGVVTGNLERIMLDSILAAYWLSKL